MSYLLAVLLVSWRLLWSLLSHSWYVPDETWQSVEVAHRVVWGKGHLTWEWGQGVRLRSVVHPALYMLVFLPLRLLGLHPTSLVILFPKCLTGVLTAVSDLALYHMARRLEGRTTASWLLLLGQTNWFSLYSGSRTLVNTFEASLFSLGLYLYPRPRYLGLAAFSLLARPTLAVTWAPLLLLHLLRTLSTRGLSSGVGHMASLLPWALAGAASVVIADSFYYGSFTLTPLNFFLFNVLHNLSQFYGENPPFWYLTHALLPILGPLIVPALLSLPSSPLVVKLPILTTIFSLSLLSHKEMRFLQPIFPLLLFAAARYMARKTKTTPSSAWVLLSLLLNIPLALYLSLVHQRGVVDAVYWLRDTPSTNSALVLMPCHSLPLHSHLHLDDSLSVRLLNCDPNLGGDDDYQDEADLFFSDPEKWLVQHDPLPGQYDTVLLFSTLEPTVRQALSDRGLHLCKSLFHTHLPGGRVGSDVRIWCKVKSDP